MFMWVAIGLQYVFPPIIFFNLSLHMKQVLSALCKQNLYQLWKLFPEEHVFGTLIMSAEVFRLIIDDLYLLAYYTNYYPSSQDS